MEVFRGYTHLITNVAIFTWIMRLEFPIEPIPLRYYIVVAIGALLPDADIRWSPIGRYNPFVGLMKHRGKFHTPWAGALVCLLLFIYYPLLGVFMFLSFLLHLLEDTANPTGIMWLHPFTKKKYSFNLCKSNGAGNLVLLSTSLMYLWKGY